MILDVLRRGQRELSSLDALVRGLVRYQVGQRLDHAADLPCAAADGPQEHQVRVVGREDDPFAFAVADEGAGLEIGHSIGIHLQSQLQVKPESWWAFAYSKAITASIHG